CSRPPACSKHGGGADMTSRSYPVSIVYAIGLLFLYVGERIVESGSNRAILSGVGALVVLFAIGLRLTRMRGASADRASVERAFLYLQLTGVGALLLYFVQSDAWAKVASGTLDTQSPKLAGVLATLWPALLTVAVLPLLLMEVAYAAMARAKVVELGRMREAT